MNTDQRVRHISLSNPLVKCRLADKLQVGKSGSLVSTCWTERCSNYVMLYLPVGIVVQGMAVGAWGRGFDSRGGQI